MLAGVAGIEPAHNGVKVRCLTTWRLTGISNEPWHYRYVGTTVAKIMKEENLCLEEYLEKYK